MAVNAGARTVRAQGKTGGRSTVNYVHIDGQTFDAVVEGGTGSTLDLFVPSLPRTARRKTGVAKATSMSQVNVWR